MGRAPCCDKSNVKRGPWSPEEDASLRAYIEEHGTGGNWIALPQKIGIKRCGKSCRLRWLNYLRPNIKHGGFSEEEDSTICNLYISIGSRWSIIAAQLPGRTDNDIKNYWNTKLKKRLLGNNKQQSENHHIPTIKQDDDLANGKNTQVLSSSALERMQLHMQLQGLHGPFSFYNNPLLWPKINSLASTTPVQQDSNTTLTKPIGEPIITTEFQSPNSITGNMQQQFNYSTPCLNRSNLDIDSAAAKRLQEELHELLYSENGCFAGLDDDRQIDSLQEFACEPWRTNGNCSLNNCFEDKPNPESWEPFIQ